MHRITGFLKNTVASVTALTVFLMFVFVGLLALVIDLGHIHAIKNELQNAADSGALAGARGLYPYDLGPDVTEEIIPDCNTAVQRAAEAVRSNWADKTPLDINENIDIQVGHWDLNSRVFTPEGGCPADRINAVRVLTRKDDAANLPVTMGFANFLGIAEVDVRAEAIGYITSAGGFTDIQCILPVAFDECADLTQCPTKTRYISNVTETAFWHSFGYQSGTDECQGGAQLIRNLLSHCTDNPNTNCPLAPEGGDYPFGEWIYPSVATGESEAVLHEVYDIFIQALTKYANQSPAERALNEQVHMIDQMQDDGTMRSVPAWRTAVLITEGCPDNYTHPQRFKDILCVNVTDVRAAGKMQQVTIDGEIYDYRFTTRDATVPGGGGYIDICVTDECAGSFPGGGPPSDVVSIRPKLVR
jgi:hypothetical protein